MDLYTSLAGEYFHAIIRSYYDLISCYAYSVAAEKVAKRYDAEKRSAHAGYWRMYVRNYHFHMFVPRYYYLLDYCAFLINELSAPQKLVPDKQGEPRYVSYDRLLEPLSRAAKGQDSRGALTRSDLIDSVNAMRGFGDGLSSQGKGLLRRFRDVVTHRYLPGIDVMTASTEREGSRTRVHSRHGRLVRITQGSGSYDQYGLPEFRFEDLEPVARVLLLSADQSLDKLHSIGTIKKAFCRSDIEANKNRGEVADYYRRVWEGWYSWFAYACDPFVKTFFFLFNGGFGGERRWRESIIDRLDLQPGDKVLDICSGTGTLAIMLARRLAGEGETVGIEISASQLKVARKKEKIPGLSFIQGDAQQIPFSDSHFDKSVICGALHEMPKKVRQNVLAEAYRVARPGGRIVISEHNKPGQKWKATLFDLMERLNPEYPTYKDMLKCGLTNEIELAGFRILKTDVTCWDYFQVVSAEKQI